MDDSGSTTFVLFDRIVTQFIGRNVQDLIAEINKVAFLFLVLYFICRFKSTLITTNSHLLGAAWEQVNWLSYWFQLFCGQKKCSLRWRLVMVISIGSGGTMVSKGLLMMLKSSMNSSRNTISSFFFVYIFFVLSYRYGFLCMPLYIRILTRKKLSF